ncbi:hypothetical protein E2C01_048466 [Portunus trituberculatus]|uniref:Uncharacterized protein n=1 Tax=Portunus trituberculatus TaxID=210409 RepID=A0A5B7GB37_PORTR|nr:hypothetical protein [Portunus trituberculatus]
MNTARKLNNRVRCGRNVVGMASSGRCPARALPWPRRPSDQHVSLNQRQVVWRPRAAAIPAGPYAAPPRTTSPSVSHRCKT